MQLTSMPLDSIAISFAVVVMSPRLSSRLRGAFIRVDDYDNLIQASCSDEAEFKRAVSIKLSAAWEFL